MLREQSSVRPAIPHEIRELFESLCADLASLHAKYALHQELFQSGENTALLSQLARPFSQIIAESLRNDITMSICRLSDPSRTLGGDAVSLATLVSTCEKIPKLEHLLTAFQSACGPVRRYRNRRLAHNDTRAIIVPRAELLPGIEGAEIDEILRLARHVLNAVSECFTGEALNFEPAQAAAAGGLIECLKRALAGHV
jgi:hypothetical protein